MVIEIRKVESVTVLDIHGKITFSEGSGELSTIIQDLVKAGDMNILLNTQDVSQVDSQGIAELVKAHITVTKQGGQIKLLSLTDRLRELLTVTKLIMVFDIYE
ncbi:STAS domain-containing protein, partial [Acidobacteria bacterium AH-259-D05]|nr:STAS domain-containing protein [Acidobacteria bacterium AH-259-D05]